MGRRVFGEKNIYLVLLYVRNYVKLYYSYFFYLIFIILLCRVISVFFLLYEIVLEKCIEEKLILNKYLLFIRYFVSIFNIF